MATPLNFIDGDLAPASQSLERFNPATGLTAAPVPASGQADVDRAVDAAQRAFPAWADLGPSRRGQILLRLGDLIESNLDELAKAESIDTGKPIFTCRTIDIPRSAANFRYFASAVQHTSGAWHDYDGAGVQSAEHAINFTHRSPRGVAGLISPWNLPLYLLTWKIAPALATGNTAVCKPSELTPTTATMLAELGNQAGLPPGVLNIIHGLGPDAGGPIVAHPRVPTISFTGSTAVGRWIGQHAGGMLKRISLELGGKNAFIVRADTDPKRAAELAVRAAFSNQGQICLCGSRLLIHRSLKAPFVEHLLTLTAALKPGDPSDPATRYGSLISKAHLAKVDGIVQRAIGQGGTILAGGGPVAPSNLPARCAGGAFYWPTIIDADSHADAPGLAPTCEALQDEIFGPVVTVQSFDDDDQLLELANGTPFGLAAVLLTNDLQAAHRLARQLQAGIVWVNCWMVRDLRTPFGGMKQSGVGREGGLDALNFFTEPKNICIAL